jgi:circadian clock protein KaiA
LTDPKLIPILVCQSFIVVPVQSALKTVNERLLICAFTSTDSVAQVLQTYFDTQPYQVMLCRSQSDFLAAIQRERQHIDCLVLWEEARLPTIVSYLQEQSLLLPILILHPPRPASVSPLVSPLCYHAAEVYLPFEPIAQLGNGIDRAIKAFLELSPDCIAEPLGAMPETAPSTAMAQQTAQDFTRRQQRLASKLKERLGYLGVYYKRDPDGFARSMVPDEREDFFRSLKESYREIIVTYFLDDPRNNDKLDGFVNTVFFADLPVSKVVEIHMDLIDEFSKQLKLEGRSEEVLLDYRLTLIDSLAHLCEMYRRSVPREIPEN